MLLLPVFTFIWLWLTAFLLPFSPVKSKKQFRPAQSAEEIRDLKADLVDPFV